MSEVQKQKQHPIPPRLEAQLKSKGASLPTQDDYGGAGNAVKGQDERPKTAPLTAFPAPMLSCALFTLDSGRCRHTRNDRGNDIAGDNDIVEENDIVGGNDIVEENDIVACYESRCCMPSPKREGAKSAWLCGPTFRRVAQFRLVPSNHQML